MKKQKTEVEAFSEINGYKVIYVKAAQSRYMRFLKYIAAAFPETASKAGVIESPLEEIMQEAVDEMKDGAGHGRVFLKKDNELPIAHSVCGRGAFNAVMQIAELLMQRESMLYPNDDYGKINDASFKALFSQYTLVVRSSALFADAVRTFAERMGFSVCLGDTFDLADAERVFVIDEWNSEDVFFGYATAGLRLAIQLLKAGVDVNEEHPLYLYLPSMEGAAVQGIIYGMRQKFGNAAYCFICSEDGSTGDVPEDSFAARTAKDLEAGVIEAKVQQGPVYIQKENGCAEAEAAAHVVWITN